MEITQRQKIIFKTIVEEFTRCAEPVGSKTLMELLDFPVSSATIRNEMATLEKLGLLEKTHTSSGRIPSQKGYRYYVEHLMEADLDASTKNALQQVFSERHYSLEEVANELKTTPESILNFLKYLGFYDYQTFVETYYKHKRIRLEQIEERMENLNICTYVERIKVSNDNKEFLKKIEEVCTKIHESKRVILVGALYPMSIAVEFQTDLISFGKTVLQYHTYDKDMIFNENDYVIFTSSSGRSLEGFMYTRTNLSLQNTTSLLITQNPTYARRKLTTDTIQVPGRFDGINFNYQIMTIFDLIRVMYYQKYIEKQG